jgi:von Willebrand factor type A domain
MQSSVDKPKLVKVIADAYDFDELTVFLADYFSTRLDHIINPAGTGLLTVVQHVVEYFEGKGNLVDLVRELGKDRPGKVDLLSLLVPVTGIAPVTPVAGGPSSTPVDIDPQVEVDFYFVVEPDRRAVSSKAKTESIYVRIPAVGASTPERFASSSAFALAFDRSGSMQGYKIDVARAAAEYILDAAALIQSRVCVIAFDNRVDTIVPLQKITDPTTHKVAVRSVAPRATTDLFAAWQEAVRSLKSVAAGSDRRVVLITDGLLNTGMVDPVKFQDEVAMLWSREAIATGCVSMGTDWNVDLLNGIASKGGGSIHFIDTVDQAQQALHEAFHASSGLVAANLRAEITLLGRARITQVNGVATSLVAGASRSYPLANQLRTNVEEELVLRVEFPPPPAGSALDILRCRLVYETATTGQSRESPEKMLRIYGEDEHSLKTAPVHQGVLCSAHTALSRQCFRQSLSAYLRDDREQAALLLSQARFALNSGPRTPRGYRMSVGIQAERLRDIERFEGRVPPEYIKEKYIDELSHRDVVWNSLSQLLDRFTGMAAETRRESDDFQIFRWANSMVDEFRHMLPVRGGEDEPFGDHVREADPRRQDESANERFWLQRAEISIPRDEDEGAKPRAQRRPNVRRMRTAVAGGACFGFERRRQGTREELGELMSRYLAIRSSSDRP